VYVVNARHYKNVPGRKSDVSDCQWLQYLHSVGLLRGSFRPAQEVCALRTLLRHREGLVQAAAEHVQHMQKALDQMNLQLHHVISDITGLTGLAILDAILDGERDPHRLAQMRNGRIRASEEVIAKALEGDYRSEHLFTLGQSLAAYRYYQELMRQCDSEIQQRLKEFDSKIDVQQHPLPPSSKSRRERLHGFHFRAQQYRIFGVDLTQVPSLNTQTVQVILAEVGPDFSRFRSGSAFASWLSVCPHNQISGGRVLSSGTRRVKNRAALALRMAAQSLHHDRSALGAFYRRTRAKLGAPKAITAAAHKLARIIYHLVTTRTAYDESVFQRAEQKYAQRLKAKLLRQAHQMGYQLVPVTPVVS
jgi:transposase